MADLLLKAKASVDTPKNDVSVVMFVLGARVVPVACFPTCALVLSECWGLVHTDVVAVP